MNKSKLNWLLNSRAYQKARGMVKTTINSPERLTKLLTKAQDKLGKYKDNALSSVIEPITTSIRLIKAYTSGEYREIPFESFALVVASVIYFVMPLDALPDFILGLGYTDDIALLSWTFRTVADELKKFSTWEISKKPKDSNIIEHQTDEP